MIVDFRRGLFVWDVRKERQNLEKHGIDFTSASAVFFDPSRLIIIDSKNSYREERWFCIGKLNGSVITVRFTYRSASVRIIGAGKWRKGRKLYEKAQA